MNHIKPPSILSIVLASIIGVVLAFTMGFSCAKLDSYKFYDGEGEIIPYRAVDSLVRSQFMERSFSKAGRDTVAAYFPVSRVQINICHASAGKYMVAPVKDSCLSLIGFMKINGTQQKYPCPQPDYNGTTLDSAIIIKKLFQRKN